jgi:ParB family chromosome partitioning protein
MTTRKGLGKGLAALISEAEGSGVTAMPANEIPVSLVDPNPFQPRQDFDEQSIEELKQSILQQGLLQPVLVRRQGERYQLIVGERRWRAVKAAGLDRIPALVRDGATDEEMLELALLENVQRKDLNPIELAHALERLQTTCSLTQEAIAEKLGVSRAHIANTIRLLKLPWRIQSGLAEGKITMGHARALLSVEDETEQDGLYERFLADGRPTVREAEELTRRARRKRKERTAPVTPAEHRQRLELARIEERLSRALSTRVRVRARSRGGVLEIRFFTSEDLERLLEILEK